MKKLLIFLAALAITAGLVAAAAGLITTARAQAPSAEPSAPVYMTAFFVCRTPDAIITMLNTTEANFEEVVNELLVKGQCATRQRGYAVLVRDKWTEVKSPRDDRVYEVYEVVNKMGAIAYSYVSKIVPTEHGV